MNKRRRVARKKRRATRERLKAKQRAEEGQGGAAPNSRRASN